jgi:hypothetical protein
VTARRSQLVGRWARPAALAAVLLTATACAETVVEVDAPAAGDELPGTAATLPSTTLPVAGSAAELLPEMATEMSRLSSMISADGDERATIARIESIWVVARPEVEAQRPELVGGIDTTVEMARTAVVRVRPADADKAFALLTDLVDRYTGDG